MTTDSKIMDFAQKINDDDFLYRDGPITVEDMEKYSEKLNSKRCSSVTNCDDDFLYRDGEITIEDMQLFNHNRNNRRCNKL